MKAGSRARQAAALAILVTLLLPATTPLSAQDKPGGFAAITVEPQSLDLGTMEQHQTRRGEITIRNDGGADLEIGDITPSCGCTVAQLDTKVLKPGASTKLAVTFDSKDYQGAQQKSITIRCNDPATPTVEVPIVVTVHVPILLNPEKPMLGFGMVRRGDTAEQKMLLTAVDTKDLKLEAVHYPKDILDVEIQQSLDGDPAKAAVVVRLRPDAPFGTFNDVLRLHTNVPSMPNIDLELIGQVLRDIDVYPETINFRYVERNQSLRQEVRVRPGGGGATKFKVKGAAIDLPLFQAKVQESIPGKETLVVITGQPLPTNDPRVVAAQGRMQGILRIFTDSATQPELQVKVIYLLKL